MTGDTGSKHPKTAGVVDRRRAAALCLGLLFALAAFPAPAAPPSVAFHYGDEMPVDSLAQFDWAVVEAGHVDERQLAGIRRHGTEVFAYVSVGETEHWRGVPETVPEAAILGENPAWDSDVVDLTHPAWREYLLEERFEPLWEAGYRGFFLDTLDSYRRFVNDEAGVREQAAALADIIRTLRERFPGVRLIVNRGFEVLDEVHGEVAAVAVESLYRRWNPGTERYRKVPEETRARLLEHLEKARDEYGLTVIAIDYVPPAERDLARETARRIAGHGFTPWVATPALDQVGVGLIEPLPRKVLILYDASGPGGGEIAGTAGHMYAAPMLEYLGYGAVYRDVGSGLPHGTLKGRYAGVVTWFDGAVPNPDVYRKWLLHQIDDGVPVAIMGDPGIAITGGLAVRLGVREAGDLARDPPSIVRYDDMLGFEGMRMTTLPEPDGVQVNAGTVRTHMRLRDAAGTGFATVVTADWGGLALSPWLIERSPGGQERWLLNPFRFFREALRLPQMPVPDATTENGSRLLLVQIDGDAFMGNAEIPGNPYNAEVILDRVLERYRYPTTVSVIQAEVAPDGLYPEISPRMEEIARRIFRLPWVEIATHTFSHPFEWGALRRGDVSGQGETAAGFNYNMPVPGYRFSLEKEIAGSAGYIDENLAPPGKHTEMVLWSGDELPPARALAIAEREGLENLNGGNTHLTRDDSSLTGVWPMLRPVGDYLQVYAPQINENVYTNQMTGPLWGYRRVIETFELTERPRRLKPIDVYYHFYSGSWPASLNALHEVYDYVGSRETLPVYASTYSRLAKAWYRMGVARRLDGGWRITGADAVRTLRLPAALGWPDMAASEGVAGARELPQGRYVALSGDARAVLKLREAAPAGPHLIRANGRVAEWRRDGGDARLRVRAEAVPLRLELGGLGGCTLRAPGASVERRGARAILSYRGGDSGTIEVDCG